MHKYSNQFDNEAVWDLNNFYSSNIGGLYAKNHAVDGVTEGEKYIDAIFAILNAEGKLK